MRYKGKANVMTNYILATCVKALRWKINADMNTRHMELQ